MPVAAAFVPDPDTAPFTMQMARGSMATDAGDAASPAALSRLSKALVGHGSAQSARKTNDKLKAVLAAVRAGDFLGGARRALKVLQADQNNGQAWHILAICQEKAGAVSEALSAYEAALKLLPDNPAIIHDLARLALRLGYLEIAEKLLQRFLAHEPGHVEATNNLACVYRNQDRYDEAVETLKAMLQIEPETPILWNTLGAVLSDQGRMQESLIFFDEALRIDPGFSKARYNRANARHPLGDEQGALEDLDAALPGAENDEERSMMQMARAMLLMGMGRLKEGFEAYEVRLDRAMPKATHFVADCPRWDPATQDITGKRLLVIGEQGIADEMIFGGTLQDIIDAVGPDGQVYVAVEPRLVGLFQRSFPAAIVGHHMSGRLKGRLTRYVPFVDEIAGREGKLDFWTPMASLLALYRTDLSAFPDRDGYLVADPAKVAYWRVELEKLGSGLKVGLHWRSSVMTGQRARYFSNFDVWTPVLTAPDCVMVNLQCDDAADDLAAAKAAGVEIWTPPIDLRNDLEDVAALSNALDVVIGPGIAGVNIAAATGARTWLIHAPDDWHLLATDRYPFYPRVRTFATGGYDGWPRVMTTLRAALEAEAAWRAASALGTEHRPSRNVVSANREATMPDIDNSPDEQDQSEVFDEDNYDAAESGGVTNEFKTFEDLPEVLDVTRADGDGDDEDFDEDETDIEDSLGADGVEPEADGQYGADGERLNQIDAESDGGRGRDEVELVYSGLMENARGAQASAAHWEAKTLSDDDIAGLGYGPDDDDNEQEETK